MALYAKMVNLHSYAFAGTKMENARLGSPSSLLCALPDHSVCVQGVQRRAIHMTLPPLQAPGAVESRRSCRKV